MARAQPIAGLDADAPILASASLIIETRLGEMLNYEPYISEVDRVYELHQMRIAAKRLRYSMEIFQSVYSECTPFGKEFEKATSEIKALQEHLGEIHDADVLVPRLEEHLARLLKLGHGKDNKGALRTGVHLVDLDACQGLLSLCLEARDERDDRYQRFRNDWQQLRQRDFFTTLVLLLKRAMDHACDFEGRLSRFRGGSMNGGIISSAQSDAHAPTPTTPATDSRPVVPPRTLSDIPGLGPIRVRALEKAGLGSLTTLRGAELSTLLAVPGLTEVKARHIQQYLAPFTAEDLAAPLASSEAANPPGPEEVKRDIYRGGASGSYLDGSAQVVQRATRAMGEVITVLLRPEAPQFRSRFLRILGQFGQCAESIATDAAHLSDEQQARAIRRLRRAAKVISELDGSAAADRKAQGRVAEALEELTTKLAECRLK